MAEIKWIKITTSMFDDEKIKLIRKMPEADAILLTWIQLLVQAGKANASGNIVLSETIPYTDEMLSAIFDRPINIVRLALQTFQQFGMVDIEDGVISISNWEKHQNVEGMDRIREQTRKRVAQHRSRQKRLPSNDTCNVTVTQDNAIDIDKELDKEKDIYTLVPENTEQDSIPFSSSPIPYKEIVDYLNEKTCSKYKHTSEKTRSLIKARLNNGFSLDDFKKVIDVKTAEWLNTEQAKYLRPETLFGNKFEGYLNQKLPYTKKQAAYEVDTDLIERAALARYS